MIRVWVEDDFQFLLKTVNHSLGSDSAFRTAGYFLCQIFAKICDVSKMKVGTAQCTVSVSIH